MYKILGFSEFYYKDIVDYKTLYNALQIGIIKFDEINSMFPKDIFLTSENIELINKEYLINNCFVLTTPYYSETIKNLKICGLKIKESKFGNFLGVEIENG